MAIVIKWQIRLNIKFTKDYEKVMFYYLENEETRHLTGNIWTSLNNYLIKSAFQTMAKNTVG